MVTLPDRSSQRCTEVVGFDLELTCVIVRGDIAEYFTCDFSTRPLALFRWTVSAVFRPSPLVVVLCAVAATLLAFAVVGHDFGSGVSRCGSTLSFN